MNEMTCREFDEVVHGLVRMELLDVAMRERALEHSLQCGNCSDRLFEAGLLAEVTEAAAEDVRAQQAPPAVEDALLKAFRGHHRRASWRRTLEWASVGAIAAIVLIFAWTLPGRNKAQSSPAPRKDISSRSMEPLDAQGTASSQSGEIIPAAETEDANIVTGETLADEDFVPLPFTDAIGPEDLGLVVRVQLTRASLTELGYPVTYAPDPADDLISADVLVGEDGWPRAVKVVQ